MNGLMVVGLMIFLGYFWLLFRYSWKMGELVTDYIYRDV